MNSFSTRYAKIPILSLMAVMLAACAGLSTQTSIVPGNAERFEVHARIGVKQGKDGFSGSVRWRRGEELDELWLYSPLGQIVAQLHQTPGLAMLDTSDKKHYEAKNTEQLLQDTYGWNIPLSGLRYWLQGTAAPDRDSLIKKRDFQNRITEMEQDGWGIEISEYSEQSGLPAKIKLVFQDLEIKLIITDRRENGGMQ